jgi:hypothetical protein
MFKENPINIGKKEMPPDEPGVFHSVLLKYF